MGDADNKHKHDTRAQITYPTRYCRQNTQTPMPHHDGKTKNTFTRFPTWLTGTTKKRTLVDKRKRQRERERDAHTEYQTRSISNHRPQKKTDHRSTNPEIPPRKKYANRLLSDPAKTSQCDIEYVYFFPVYHNINDPKPLMQESTRRPTRPLPPIDLAPAWYNRWKDPVR